MIHELKTAPVYFNRSWSGEKLFEVRKNDRHFQKGDSITYVLSGFNAIDEQYVVFGFKIDKRSFVGV